MTCLFRLHLARESAFACIIGMALFVACSDTDTEATGGGAAGTGATSGTAGTGATGGTGGTPGTGGCPPFTPQPWDGSAPTLCQEYCGKVLADCPELGQGECLKRCTHGLSPGNRCGLAYFKWVMCAIKSGTFTCPCSQVMNPKCQNEWSNKICANTGTGAAGGGWDGQAGYGVGGFAGSAGTGGNAGFVSGGSGGAF